MHLDILSLLDPPPTASPSILNSSVQLVATLVWPTVLIAFLVTQRKVISRLLSALALLAESANKIKVWQIEIERSIDQEVDKAARSAQGIPSEKPTVPKADVVAAARVETLVGQLADSQGGASVLKSVRLRMVVLGEQYDKTREEMISGSDRTIAMNAIIAQMRTLAIAAKVWLKEFSEFDKSAGIRLCAIAILQLSPNHNYLEWLGERFSVEQPFVFFQAAIALREAARSLGTDQKPRILTILTASLAQLRSFEGEKPDQNSIYVLSDTLEALQSGSIVVDQPYPN